VTEQQRNLLVLLGAAAVVVFLVSPWSPLPGAKTPGGTAGDSVWRAGYPAGHDRLCQPDQIPGGPLLAPHSLYARPPRCGHNRSCLIEAGGWDWIINPPSERDLPL
jgi:hypothetical protein